MDFSIQGSGGVETESLSDDQSNGSGHHENLPNINMNRHGSSASEIENDDTTTTSTNMHQTTSATTNIDEDELVEAMDNHGLPVLSPRSSNCGYLERCGRWLCAIPRDDVVALQQTSEYREFLAAFDRLGEVCDHKSIVHILYISLILFIVYQMKISTDSWVYSCIFAGTQENSNIRTTTFIGQ